MEEKLESLQKEEETASKQTQENLILEHIPFVYFIVSRLKARLPQHVDGQALYAAGMLGLFEAACKYDKNKNIKFGSYAIFRINGAVLDELRTLDWAPRSIREKSRIIQRAYKAVEQRLGRKAYPEDIAEELKMSIEEYYEFFNKAYGILIEPLEDVAKRKTSDDGGEEFNVDGVVDMQSPDPYAVTEHEEFTHTIQEAIEDLSEIEKKVIRLFFYEGLTEKDIGSVLSIAPSEVWRVKARALKLLRSRKDVKQLMH